MVYPSAIKAYTAPIVRPFTSCCRRTACQVMVSRGSFADGFADGSQELELAVPDGEDPDGAQRRVPSGIEPMRPEDARIRPKRLHGGQDGGTLRTASQADRFNGQAGRLIRVGRIRPNAPVALLKRFDKRLSRRDRADVRPEGRQIHPLGGRPRGPRGPRRLLHPLNTQETRPALPN